MNIPFSRNLTHAPKPKFESRDYYNLQSARWAHMITICIVLCIFATTAWFVYSYIYETIGKAQILLVVQANPDFEPINFKLYNQTRDAWKKRMELHSPSVEFDPFYATHMPITTSTLPTSTITDTIDDTNTSTSIPFENTTTTQQNIKIEQTL